MGFSLMSRVSERNQDDGLIAVGPLLSLIDALERKRAIFWTGHVLVEFEEEFIPPGQVTMVLDEGDMAMLSALKIQMGGAVQEIPKTMTHESTVIEKLGGLTSDEAELLAEASLIEAAEFRQRASSNPLGSWHRFADWKQRRARLFKQLAASESEAQAEYERRHAAQKNQEKTI